MIPISFPMSFSRVWVQFREANLCSRNPAGPPAGGARNVRQDQSFPELVEKKWASCSYQKSARIGIGRLEVFLRGAARDGRGQEDGVRLVGSPSTRDVPASARPPSGLPPG